MKKIYISVLSLILLLFGAFYTFACGENTSTESSTLESKLISFDRELDTVEMAELVTSAIVGISGETKVSTSIGSGVCVAQDGYIVTNSHVIDNCNNITLYLSNGTTASADVIYNDTVLDLAVVKSKKSLPYLKLGNSDNLLVGEDVVAVGTPLSLSLTHTFTKGIVSALNRTLKVSSTDGNGYMQNLIQHDASLNPGNSGGPLLNSFGEVVGINTLKISSGEGIGFAIPTKSFSSLLSSFVKDINYDRAYLGVLGYDSSIANYYDKNKSDEGFYIEHISEFSPLKDCGVKDGAVIVSFNNRKITNTLDLKDELYTLSSTDTAYLEYEYNGEKIGIKTKLSKQN